MYKVIQPDPSPILTGRPEDLDEILAVMKLANQYALDKSGSLLWVTDHADIMIRRHLERGESFVMRNDDGTIAALITLDEEDAYSWGDLGSDGQALYFHKLMKNPEHPQPNTGLKFLHFAAQEALRRDKHFLRCDTKASMPGLIAYYDKLGIIKQREIVYKHSGLAGALLQGAAQTVLERTTQQLS